jgi:hypothetical protein
MDTSEDIFTERERALLCFDALCEEHGNGGIPCSLPRTKQHAIEIAKREIRGDSNTLTLSEHAEPKTATAIVEYSDDA